MLIHAEEYEEDAVLLKIPERNLKPFFFPSCVPLIEVTDEVLCDPVRIEKTDQTNETYPQGTVLKRESVQTRGQEMKFERNYSG